MNDAHSRNQTVMAGTVACGLAPTAAEALAIALQFDSRRFVEFVRLEMRLRRDRQEDEPKQHYAFQVHLEHCENGEWRAHWHFWLIGRVADKLCSRWCREARVPRPDWRVPETAIQAQLLSKTRAFRPDPTPGLVRLIAACAVHAGATDFRLGTYIAPVWSPGDYAGYVAKYLPDLPQVYGRTWRSSAHAERDGRELADMKPKRRPGLPRSLQADVDAAADHLVHGTALPSGDGLASKLVAAARFEAERTVGDDRYPEGFRERPADAPSPPLLLPDTGVVHDEYMDWIADDLRRQLRATLAAEIKAMAGISRPRHFIMYNHPVAEVARFWLEAAQRGWFLDARGKKRIVGAGIDMSLHGNHVRSIRVGSALARAVPSSVEERRRWRTPANTSRPSP